MSLDLFCLFDPWVPSTGGAVSPDCSTGCWYDSGSADGLWASPAFNYGFTTWTGDCAGTNPSTSVSMSVTRNCAANFVFCTDRPVRNKSTPTALFISVSSVYDAAKLEDTIQIIATKLNETLDLNLPISLTLAGGYDCGFTEPAASYSIIQGAMTIDRDSLSVTIQNLILQ